VIFWDSYFKFYLVLYWKGCFKYWYSYLLNRSRV
jgi:hypothetical protein